MLCGAFKLFKLVGISVTWGVWSVLVLGCHDVVDTMHAVVSVLL